MAIVLEVGCSDHLSVKEPLSIVINSLSGFHDEGIRICRMDMTNNGVVEENNFNIIDNIGLDSIINDYDTGVYVSFKGGFFCLWPPRQATRQQSLWTFIVEQRMVWGKNVLDQIAECPSVLYVMMSHDDTLIYGEEFDFLENPRLPTDHCLYIDGRIGSLYRK